MNEEALKKALTYIDSWLGYLSETEDFPGLVVGVQYRDKLLLESAYGHANIEKNTLLAPDNLLRVASNSKMFTATAIMLLFEAGQLKLDDRVSHHLPWFKSENDPQVEAITIRQLLSHGSGIIRDGNHIDFWVGNGAFPKSHELKDFIRSTRLTFPINDQFKYSNIGFSFLSFVVEAVSGVAYEIFVQKHILEPLKLASTHVDYSHELAPAMASGHRSKIRRLPRVTLPQLPTHSMAAATGFCSTVKDLCRFGATQFIGNEELLSDASKREMQRLQMRSKDKDYGLGLQIYKVEDAVLVGHGAGFLGFTGRTLVDPHRQLVVSVFANSHDTPADRLANSVLKVIEYFQKHDVSHSTPDKLEQYEGRFYSLWGADDIVAVGDVLHAVQPHSFEPFKDPVTLIRQSNSDAASFRIQDPNGTGHNGETLTYVFGDDGVPKRITYAGFTEYTWDEFRKQQGKNLAAS